MKGKAQIILTDAESGKSEVVREENMFTNALDSVFNENPYGILGRNLGYNTAPAESGSGKYPYYKTNTIKKALGGLLLFPEAIDENPDTLYAPVTNVPTGYASDDGDVGSDTKKGVFNEVESGYVDNGYKFVWDFGTSAANGTIACLSLTHAYGGKAYFNELSGAFSGSPMNPGTNYARAAGRFNITNTLPNESNVIIGVASDDEWIVYLKGNDVYRVHYPKNKYLIKPVMDTDNIFENAEKLFSLSVSSTHDTVVTAREGESAFYVVEKPNGSTNFHFSKYDMSGAEIDTGYWHPTGIALLSQINGRVVPMVGDYLYWPGNNWYRINTANPADVSNTNLKFVAGADGIHGYGIFGRAVCANGVIEGTLANESTDSWVPKFSRMGCWALGFKSYAGGGTQNLALSATLCTPYLATINNLKSPIMKDASKTMKVVYTVTQE